MRTANGGNPGPSELKKGKDPFPGKFGNKAGAMLAVASFLVLLFGTIPLWFSHRILKNSEEISRLNTHTRLMEEIHSTSHHIGDFIEERAAGSEEARKQLLALSDKLMVLSKRFKALHDSHPSGWEERGEEKMVFKDVSLLTNTIVAFANTAEQSGPEIRRKAQTLMPKVTLMAAIHQRLVNEIITENHFRMRWIFNLYYALIIVGVLVIAGGIFWVSRSIVQPVKRLAAAAREIADGDFSKRVKITSDDELGQLSHSFNVMASRLQGHESYIQGMATLEERERLAREMHDGLAQNIGFMNLKLAELERRLARNDASGMRETLSILQETVTGLYNDVRQAIFGLRVMVSRQLGLLPTLTEYLHEFSQQTGIHVDVMQEEEWGSNLPAETEVQLIRIIQEALTNVRKHAGASRISIHFRKAEENLEIVIEDDGCGMSRNRAELAERPTFGLQTMAERAQSVGGSFEIQNTFPSGTQISVCLPLSVVSRRAGSWTE